MTVLYFRLPDIKILFCSQINHHLCTNTDYIFTIVQDGFKQMLRSVCSSFRFRMEDDLCRFCRKWGTWSDLGYDMCWSNSWREAHVCLPGMMKMGVKYSQMYSDLRTSTITILHHETLVSPTVAVHNKMKRILLHLTY